ncbi:MAG: GNAT family N-acetyltransferase [Bacteroidetes bacterium]|nr:GNAT family N-acetyltransferase [Bacteroidota bacterium]
MKIIDIQEKHYPSISNIYLEGISTGNATFQTTAPSWEEWHQTHLQHSRFVVIVNNEIAGWAALSAVSSRCVYAGVAEVSIYIGEQFRSQNIGYNLLLHLIKSSEENGFWTLQSGIFSENLASIKLHKKCDFRMIGCREKIGKLNGVWKDNVIMERRSKTIGI